MKEVFPTLQSPIADLFRSIRHPLRIFRISIFVSSAIATCLFIAYNLFSFKGFWLNFLILCLAIILLYATKTGHRHLIEEIRGREIKRIFSTYVTEKIVNELVKNPEMARLGGERKEVTILFADIKGFTSFSERHEPEEVVAILNEYLKTMTDVVFRWDGTLDKFVGDAVMVFWGAPTEQGNHAELAVRCALDMMNKLKKLRQKWISEGREPIDIGIGVNTGEVVVGNMGAEGKKMDYTVVGDHVNLGARAEGLTRHYDSHIIITEFTYARLKEVLNRRIGHVDVKRLDSVRVKGKENPVTIYGIESIDRASVPACLLSPAFSA